MAFVCCCKHECEEERVSEEDESFPFIMALFYNGNREAWLFFLTIALFLRSASLEMKIKCQISPECWLSLCLRIRTLLLLSAFIFWPSCFYYALCPFFPFFDGIWGLDFCSLISWTYIDAKLNVDEDHIASRSK